MNTPIPMRCICKVEQLFEASDLLTEACQQVEPISFFSACTSMTVLSTDAGFLCLIDGHIGLLLAFAARLFDFLRVIGKAVMVFLSFGHGQSPDTKNWYLHWIDTLSFRPVDTTNGAGPAACSREEVT
ncbi:hypothetical protein J2W17_002491 [Pseudomonas lini]|nr:hypothetical protein [Pseudomonas lini]